MASPCENDGHCISEGQGHDYTCYCKVSRELKWSDRSVQTMQTLIRLLLKEKSDESLHCLLFYFHLLEALLAV